MKKFIFIFILLTLFVFVGLVDPYARRIRPFTSVPVACAENEVGYSMTLHKPYICTNAGYKELLSSVTAAPIDATFITETANSSLTNEFALGSLATGILKNTTTTGIPSIAVAGTDYESPLTFTANDFDRATNTVSIDYTNGQAATGSVKGFLTAANWTTFNNKESALTFNSPLSRSTNTISCSTCALNGSNSDITATSALVTIGGSAGITIGPTGANALIFNSNNTGRWKVDSDGHFVAVTDNAFDIGASSGTRPRNLYVAGNAIIKGNLISTTVASGDMVAGTYMASNGNGNFILSTSSTGNSGDKLQLAYYNQTNWFSALEYANPASGFTTLALIKSGGLLTIGNGTGISKHLSATATLDFANLAAIGCEDLTITVTGAADGDSVDIGVPNGSIVANGNFFGWVSATDTVSIRFCTVVSGNPASGTFRADVWKH